MDAHVNTVYAMHLLQNVWPEIQDGGRQPEIAIYTAVDTKRITVQ